jgi:hypothetical protein
MSGAFMFLGLTVAVWFGYWIGARILTFGMVSVAVIVRQVSGVSVTSKVAGAGLFAAELGRWLSLWLVVTALFWASFISLTASWVESASARAAAALILVWMTGGLLFALRLLDEEEGSG